MPPSTNLNQIFNTIATLPDETVPSHVPKSFWEQLKISRVTESNLATAAFAARRGANEVLLDESSAGGNTFGSGTWPFNITGTAVTTSATISPPAGITAGTTYYIINVSSDGWCKLAASYSDAINNIPVTITGAETGIWTITYSGAAPLNTRLWVYDTVSNSWKYANLV